MAALAQIVLLSLGATLARCAPQASGVDESDVDGLLGDDEINDGHLTSGWVVAVAVVLPLVICTVIGVAVYVKIRQRRRQSRTHIANSPARSSMDPNLRRQSGSPLTSDDKASQRIASPLPALTYDRRVYPT